MNSIVKEDVLKIIEQDLPWDEFREKTILITGANGFIPSYMVETLLVLNKYKLNDSMKIVAVVRNMDKGKKRFINYLMRDDFMLIDGNICSPIDIEVNIDYIVHAASQASPKYYGVDPIGTLEPNVLGTYYLLSLAKEKKIKSFLFISSGEVYGKVTSTQLPINEKNYGYIDPIDVRSCYAESKRMGENICISYYQQYNVPVKIARPFHTYGPGVKLDDGRVFADFVSDVVNNRNIIMKSDGKATRTFCYIADAVTGLFTVLLKGENGQAYNVSNDNCEISILELAKLLIELFPERELKVVSQVRTDTEYLISPIERAIPDITMIKTLGWIPSYSIEEGFKRMINSYEVYKE